MELRELLAGADVIEIVGDPDDRHLGPRLRQPPGGPGALFFAIPGFTADGHEFAPLRRPGGRDRGRGRAPARARAVRRPGGRRATPARRWRTPRCVSSAIRPPSCGSPGSPARTGRRRRRSWSATSSSARGIQTGLLGTVKRVVGGVEEPVERTTPEAIELQATFRRMVDGGRPRLRDGGLLARAQPQPRRRDPLRGRRVHQPDPGPPRLPRRHGGLLPRQAPPVRGRRAERLVTNIDDPYGDKLAAEFDPITFSAAGDERRRPARRRPRVRRLRVALPAGDRGRRGRCRAAAARPLQRRERPVRARLRVGARRRSGRRGRGARRAPTGCRAASSRSTRASRSRYSSTTRTRRTRSRTCSPRRARSPRPAGG